jgi:hypothetical protein
MERDRLIAAKRRDLAEQISHVAVVEGDSAGYDIRSYENDGTLRLIEVKTTRGPSTAAFFVSPNELSLSQSRADDYVLIRIFSYVDATDSGMFYEVRGRLDDAFDFAPTEFRASLARDER